MKAKNKYIVYVNNEWLDIFAEQQYGPDYTAFDRYKLATKVHEAITSFLTGDGSVMMADTFVDKNGKRQKCFDIKIIAGRHGGKALKRLRNPKQRKQ